MIENLTATAKKYVMGNMTSISFVQPIIISTDERGLPVVVILDDNMFFERLIDSMREKEQAYVLITKIKTTYNNKFMLHIVAVEHEEIISATIFYENNKTFLGTWKIITPTLN